MVSHVLIGLGEGESSYLLGGARVSQMLIDYEIYTSKYYISLLGFDSRVSVVYPYPPPIIT